MDNQEENSNKKKIYKPGDAYDIPYEGSLGLLALGYRGLKLFRSGFKG